MLDSINHSITIGEPLRIHSLAKFFYHRIQPEAPLMGPG
jgi:hypothetical protein